MKINFNNEYIKGILFASNPDRENIKRRRNLLGPAAFAFVLQAFFVNSPISIR